MIKRITSGDLARAIAKFNPIVNDDMTRVWCERGLIPARRNPGNDRGWWYVVPQELPTALQKMHFQPQEIQLVVNILGLNIKQCRFF